MVKKTLLAFFPIILLVSCGFFFGTPFPAELPYYNGLVKLPLSFSSYRLDIVNDNCFLACGDQFGSTSSMVIVNQSMNIVNAGLSGNFGNLVMQDTDSGCYLVGDQVLNTDMSKYTGPPKPFDLKTNPQDYGFTAKDDYFGSNGYYVIFAPNGPESAWIMTVYNQSWALLATRPISFTITPTNYRARNIAYDPDPDGNSATHDGKVVFILEKMDSTINNTETFRVPLYGLATGLYNGYDTSYPFGLTPFYVPSGMGGKPAYTRDGIVYYDSNTGFTLKKWNSETITSYIGQNSSGNLTLNFDPTGSYWFIYDRQKQILSRGKKWW